MEFRNKFRERLKVETLNYNIYRPSKNHRDQYFEKLLRNFAKNLKNRYKNV